MAGGWIKLHRQILDYEHYDDSAHVHVWIHLLLKATHTGLERTFAGRRVTLRPGQLITGRKVISRDTGVNESKVRRILERLKEDGQIDQQTSNRSSLVTIRNWHLYQDTDQQTATYRTPTDPPPDTDKKTEGGELIYPTAARARTAASNPPTLATVKAYAVTIGLPEKEAVEFFHHYESQGWVTGNGIPIRKWQSRMVTWKNQNLDRKGRSKAAQTPLEADYDNPDDPLTGKGHTS